MRRLSLTGVAIFLLSLSPRAANAAAAYVRSNVGAPWGQNRNEAAMDLVFGVGGWDDLRYEVVDPNVLFSDAYDFVYLEGSDSNATEMETFLSAANRTKLEDWVWNGGSAFLNAAPNEDNGMAFGFRGVTLVYPDFAVNPGSAANVGHSIWNGPNRPCATSFSGGAFAHGSISGGVGLVALITDSGGGNPQLSELSWGLGRVFFGGLTTSNFWNPVADALNLRANIIAYLAGVVDDGGGAVDTDADGITDALDNCVNDANATQDDADGDGLGDVCDPVDDNDLDADGIANDADNCPFDANATQTDADADGIGDACDGRDDLDLDGDGHDNLVDNCPFISNAGQQDEDGDGLGDACDDSDGTDADADGVLNTDDNCAFVENPGQEDADADGLGDACDPTDGLDLDGDGIANEADNCAFVPNDDQADVDMDGLGDVCDPGGDDLDLDEFLNGEDNCPFVANPSQDDSDADGIGDDCDQQDGRDLDLDGALSPDDNCPFVSNADQLDADGDGIGDVCDPPEPSTKDDVGCCTVAPGTGRFDREGALLLVAVVAVALGRRRLRSR
jgi:hypothetical protein